MLKDFIELLEGKMRPIPVKGSGIYRLKVVSRTDDYNTPADVEAEYKRNMPIKEDVRWWLYEGMKEAKADKARKKYVERGYAVLKGKLGKWKAYYSDNKGNSKRGEGSHIAVELYPFHMDIEPLDKMDLKDGMVLVINSAALNHNEPIYLKYSNGVLKEV